MLPESLNQHFALSPDLAWKELGEGHMNDSWVGVDNFRPILVLRRYTRTDRLEEIGQEHHLLTYLEQQAGTLVAAPLPGNSGNTIQMVEGRPYAVFPFRPGKEMTHGVKEQLQPAAETQAFLHFLLVKYEPTAGFSQTRPGLLEREWRVEPSLVDFIDHSAECQPLRKQNYSSANLEAAINKVQTNQTTPELQKLRRMVIHTDFASSNILWDSVNQKVLTVLDWEEARWDIPLFDMADCKHIASNSPEDRAIYLDYYFQALEKLDKELAGEIKATLPWLTFFGHTANLADLLLFFKLTLEQGRPLHQRYMMRLAKACFG